MVLLAGLLPDPELATATMGMCPAAHDARSGQVAAHAIRGGVACIAASELLRCCANGGRVAAQHLHHRLPAATGAERCVPWKLLLPFSRTLGAHPILLMLESTNARVAPQIFRVVARSYPTEVPTSRDCCCASNLYRWCLITPD